MALDTVDTRIEFEDEAPKSPDKKVVWRRSDKPKDSPTKVEPAEKKFPAEFATRETALENVTTKVKDALDEARKATQQESSKIVPNKVGPIWSKSDLKTEPPD